MALATGAHPAATSSCPAIENALAFVARRWLAILLVSAVLLIPCFWHHHIQATDLGSHVYNSCLAQLIQYGAAPGLQIVPQHSNVLFDVILTYFFQHVGPLAAERIAVSLTALIFFWGAFALCSAAAQRSAWSIVPLLAMASYGFIFNMGFFNMYLAVGFALWALAIVWRGERWDLLLLAPLLVLTWLSHLIGVVGLLALGAYLLLMRRLPLRWQLALSGLGIAAYFVALWYLRTHFGILARQDDVYWMGGADQFVVDNGWFTYIGEAVLIVSALTIALTLARGGSQTLHRMAPWLQVYALVAIASACAPGGIWHPRLHSMGYLPDRLSLYSAVFLCCLLASARPAKWQVAAFGAIAVAFFALLYSDTLRLDRMETRVEVAVQAMKPGDRVVATFLAPEGARLQEEHFADRACIGHCFFIANYEPPSGQFRIRVSGPNRIVADSSADAEAMQRGKYAVKAEDLPLSEIYACGAGLEEICVHPLATGERNGEVAFRAAAR